MVAPDAAIAPAAAVNSGTKGLAKRHGLETVPGSERLRG